jgi:hypothetical protein
VIGRSGSAANSTILQLCPQIRTSGQAIRTAGQLGVSITPLASAENAAVDAASSNADAPSFRPAPEALCSEWTMQTCSPKSEGEQINDGT